MDHSDGSGQLEFVKGLEIGILAGDFAVSDNDSGTGYAIDLDFTRTQAFGPREDRVSWGLSAGARSEEFSGLNGLTGANRTAYETRAFWTRTFFESGSSINLDASYLWGRNDEEDRWRTRIGYNKRLTRIASLSTDLTWENREDEDDFGFGLRLTVRPNAKSNASASYTSRNERASANWQQRGDSSFGAWSAGVDLDRTPETSGANANGFLIGARGDVGLNHRTQFDGTYGDVTSQVTSLRGGTAIGFADGAFAIGRPVGSSFAIVQPHESLRGSRVGIKSAAVSGSVTGSPIFGPAMVSDLPSYSKRNLEYDVRDLPIGYDLGAGSADVRAPFYAGYKLVVGSDLNITVMGRALDAWGEPVGYLLGVVTSLDRDDIEPVEIFTNGDGKFGAPGLGPGRWQVRFATQPDPTIITFDIPDDGETFVRLGDLQGETE